MFVSVQSRDPWEKQKVVEKLIVIGENDTMDPDIRGSAIDNFQDGNFNSCIFYC